MANYKGRKLILNLSPIKYDDTTLDVGVFDFHDKDQLRALRKENYRTHVFRRVSNEILCVPFETDAPTIGDSFREIKLKKNLGLSAALIQNALLNYLHSIGRTILEYIPLTFLSDSQTNFIAASLRKGISCPSWLALIPSYEADIRVVTIDRYSPFVGLALNVQTTWLIDRTCKELLGDGFPLVGLYVGKYLDTHDDRVRPRFQRIGRVRDINGDMLLLDDSRDEIHSIDAKEALLVRDHDSIDSCLAHCFGKNAAPLGESLKVRLAEFRNGRNRLNSLNKVVSYLGGLDLEMLPGLNFSILPFFAEGVSKVFPTVQVAAKPTYVFDPAGRRTDTWHDRGLEVHGPYAYQNHTPTKPKVCVICQASQKGQVEQFLYKFKNGIAQPKAQHSPGGQNKKAPFAQGLVRKYKLNDVEFEFFTADDDKVDSYMKAARQALAQERDRDIRWDLALVQIEERFHKLYGDANPYFATKAAFLAHQVPVQEFETETAALPDNQLGYVLNNMALATYAKLGGVPWLMKANPALAHEIVFGLGSASIGKGRLGKRERIVGITTVFTGDGNYHLSNLSQAVPMADYGEALLDSLKVTIAKVKQELNWQKRDHVRLVFHSFKPFKDLEADAVKKAVAELSDYDVDLAFIHIADNHPYRLFDENQEGVFDPRVGKVKGVCAPDRGYFLQLSSYEVLLTTTGARDIKQPQHGMPRPILLKLHRNSTFNDMTYLARQVFAFSCHSWRSFFPSPMPVTIMYSDLMAGLLGNLATVSLWNPDSMLGRIGKTRWFL
jgi:argonaute-like protein